jgi:hypothetical protein
MQSGPGRLDRSITSMRKCPKPQAICGNEEQLR